MKKPLLHPNKMKALLFITFIICAGYSSAQSASNSTEAHTWDLSKATLEEKFGKGQLPDNWQIIKESDTPEDNIQWSFQNPMKRVINGAGFDENFAIVDTEYGDGTMSAATSLVTPPMTCGAAFDPLAYKVILTYSGDYPHYGNSSAQLLLSTDMGNTWNVISGIGGVYYNDGVIEPYPYTERMNLTKYFQNGQTILLKWKYEGHKSGYLALDNISIKFESVESSYVQDITRENSFIQGFWEKQLPEYWRVVSESDIPEDNVKWSFENPGNKEIRGKNFSGYFAIADTWLENENQSAHTSLITPSLTCHELTGSPQNQVLLNFSYDYPTYGNSHVWLQISTDAGKTWKILKELKGTLQTAENPVSNPLTVKMNLTDYFRNEKNIQLKWTYEGRNDGYLAIDDISVKYEEPTFIVNSNNTFAETFDENQLPVNWQIIKESDIPEDNIQWSFLNPMKRVIEGNGFDENFAIADSQSGDGLLSANTSLVTPPMVCYNLADKRRDFVYMSFVYDFPTYGNGTANLQVSIDNSEKWDTLMVFKGTSQTQNEIISNPQRIFSYDFNVTCFFREGKTVRFKWNYSGSNDGYFALDDVRIWWDHLLNVENTKEITPIYVQSCANNQFVISAPSLSIEKVSVLTMTGAKIMQNQGNRSSEQTVSATEIPPGIYILAIDTDKASSTKKIIIR